MSPPGRCETRGGSGVGVGLGVGVAVGVGVGVGTALAVGVAVAVAIVTGAGVGVAVGVGSGAAAGVVAAIGAGLGVGGMVTTFVGVASDTTGEGVSVGAKATPGVSNDGGVGLDAEAASVGVTPIFAVGVAAGAATAAWVGGAVGAETGVLPVSPQAADKTAIKSRIINQPDTK